MGISRRQFLAGTLALSAQPSKTGRPPNFVIILADDQGWGDLSVHGNTNLSTPNIDSLARDGALFDRFYVCPVCAPTRAEYMTKMPTVFPRSTLRRTVESCAYMKCVP